MCLQVSPFYDLCVRDHDLWVREWKRETCVNHHRTWHCHKLQTGRRIPRGDWGGAVLCLALPNSRDVESYGISCDGVLKLVGWVNIYPSTMWSPYPRHTWIGTLWYHPYVGWQRQIVRIRHACPYGLPWVQSAISYWIGSSHVALDHISSLDGMIYNIAAFSL